MRPRLFVGAALVLFTSALVAAQGRTTQPGVPLSGITAAEFEEFRLGLEDFLEVETAEEGLGPAFNATSCAACHNIPAIGGTGTIAEMRAGYINDSGQFETLDETGETLFHLFSVPGHTCQPMIPTAANVFARRVPIPLFGAGLVEAIPDTTLLDLEDPHDRNRDGVSGRAAIVNDAASGERRVGRFGWKAQHATLLAFGADAYRNEMGITNELFPQETGYGIGVERMRFCDPSRDPEDLPDPRTSRRGIDNFASFMRFLAPVARDTVNDPVRIGEQVFASLGCAACHVPALVTGPSSNPVFHQRLVPLFSDLLLHDIGTGDGIKQAAAEPNEIRTPALWGLRLRRPLLHDGSAGTVTEAVRRHRQEAELARRGFERLTDSDRAALLAFLNSL
jgi:CxxC motif-containing protein (DUF1111 family)